MQFTKIIFSKYVTVTIPNSCDIHLSFLIQVKGMCNV